MNKKMVNDVYAFTYFVSTKNERMLSGCFSHFSFPFDFSLFKRTVHTPVEEWRNSFEFGRAFFAKPAARVIFYSTPHTLRCVLHRFACATIQSDTYHIGVNFPLKDYYHFLFSVVVARFSNNHKQNICPMNSTTFAFNFIDFGENLIPRHDNYDLLSNASKITRGTKSQTKH